VGTRRRLGGHALLALLTLIVAAAALAEVAGVPRALHPVTAALGLDQDWRMFAPHPRRSGLRLEAVVDWSDGSRDIWVPPASEPLVGAYRDYRWRKWMEHASSDHEARLLLPPLARYLARRIRERPGARPVRLRVIRYELPLSPPGERAATDAIPVELYRADLSGARR
jgi:hypothetical protein